MQTPIEWSIYTFTNRVRTDLNTANTTSFVNEFFCGFVQFNKFLFH